MVKVVEIITLNHPRFCKISFGIKEKRYKTQTVPNAISWISRLLASPFKKISLEKEKKRLLTLPFVQKTLPVSFLSYDLNKATTLK
uniref:Uncharacterized protein n=1 Tax=Rhizophora mucronata TaxID=61149 RepID=A0A2P2QCL1_RHIMU